jgi:hypothetical protein
MRESLRRSGPGPGGRWTFSAGCWIGCMDQGPPALRRPRQGWLAPLWGALQTIRTARQD